PGKPRPGHRNRSGAGMGLGDSFAGAPGIGSLVDGSRAVVHGGRGAHLSLSALATLRPSWTVCPARGNLSPGRAPGLGPLSQRVAGSRPRLAAVVGAGKQSLSRRPGRPIGSPEARAAGKSLGP